MSDYPDLRFVPHAVGPVERILLDHEQLVPVGAVGVALSDAEEGQPVAVRIGRYTATGAPPGARMLLTQRCLYCDAVIRVEGEADWPLPVGRLVASISDCPRRLT